MGTRRLLIAYAHPDDESFGLGGMIAKYVAEGVEVSLICATNGDVGTVSPEMLNGYASIAELRLSELDKAVDILKIKHVFKFGYKDSGMMGSATCEDSACLWKAPQDELTRRVVEVIRQVRPQVVVTFNKYGGYGHPDHIAIQRATTTAFPLAGNSEYATGTLKPYAPQKLYYSNIPRRQLELMIRIMKLRGQNPRALGKNNDIDLVQIVENAEPIHTLVDIRHFYPQWDAASAVHKSQLGGRMPRVPKSLRPILSPHQGFTRVYPIPTRRGIDERDMFVNVVADEAAAAAV